mmetsp:Transcript_91730/g.182247  ORF Transcript_91730/g.182247 Transcript_91730/m.182247 type:complete len:294 (-) Transcript_91730:153-1034(-)
MLFTSKSVSPWRKTWPEGACATRSIVLTALFTCASCTCVNCWYLVRSSSFFSAFSMSASSLSNSPQKPLARAPLRWEGSTCWGAMGVSAVMRRKLSSPFNLSSFCESSCSILPHSSPMDTIRVPSSNAARAVSSAFCVERLPPMASANSGNSCWYERCIFFGFCGAPNNDTPRRAGVDAGAAGVVPVTHSTNDQNQPRFGCTVAEGAGACCCAWDCSLAIGDAADPSWLLCAITAASSLELAGMDSTSVRATNAVFSVCLRKEEGLGCAATGGTRPARTKRGMRPASSLKLAT